MTMATANNIERRSAGSRAADIDVSAAPWWRGAVIYQIYPRSFLDTNGDGIGDLKGVAERLDYVASLGVDGVWLSPFFASPMKDYGYDVADYCDVDAMFGTLADFDAVVARAHALGLKVIIDQVYSHTSDMHAWFAESRESRENAKADWYVWADPKPDGSPPNNWLSVFSGPAWEWDARREQYYLHNFLSSQPDLNVHNREVQDALLDVSRFWLDRGVDGFRLDAINFAMHDPSLRDNPPAERAPGARTRPFDYQLHRYNQSHPDIPKFLERIRAVTNDYNGVFTVAEIGGPDPLPEMQAFTASDMRLNSAYNFDFLYTERLAPEKVRRALGGWRGEANEGWPSWAFSNHDAPRAVSRWASEETRPQAAKLHAMVLMTLRGNAFLYQGEELGLPQAEVAFDDLKDPEALANWPVTLGRDGARTPMPWRSEAPHGGFSSARGWLPVAPTHLPHSVEAQERDADSPLLFMRRLIALRSALAPLRHGEQIFLPSPEHILAYRRRAGAGTVLCAFNLGEEPIDWRAPEAAHAVIRLQVGLDEKATTPPERLAPLSGFIAEEAR